MSYDLGFKLVHHSQDFEMLGFKQIKCGVVGF